MTTIFTRRGATVSAEEIASLLRDTDSSADSFSAVTMDRFDREMIELLLSWAPYGDPPEEECLPRFGTTVDGVKARVQVLIEASSQLCIEAYDRALLARSAWLLGIPTPPPLYLKSVPRPAVSW